MRHLTKYLNVIFKKKDQHSYSLQEWIINISICEITALSTFYIHTMYHQNIVLVASFIGIILGLISTKERFKNIQFVGYCGVFVGMSSTLIFPTLLSVCCAGIIAGVIYNLSTSLLFGYGGRLGTIAFLSVWGVYVLNIILR